MAYGWAMEDTTGIAKVIVEADKWQDPRRPHLLQDPPGASLIQPLIQAMSFRLAGQDMARAVLDPSGATRGDRERAAGASGEPPWPANQAGTGTPPSDEPRADAKVPKSRIRAILRLLAPAFERGAVQFSSIRPNRHTSSATTGEHEHADDEPDGVEVQPADLVPVRRRTAVAVASRPSSSISADDQRDGDRRAPVTVML